MHLGIFVTHPIQYFAPLWRELARTQGLSLSVYFFSDHSVRGGVDPGFGVQVAWDVPLLEGYRSRFLRRDSDLSRPWSVQLPRAAELIEHEGLDAVLVHGYTHRFEAQLVAAARRLGKRTLLRAELTDQLRPGAAAGVARLARQLYLDWFLGQIDAFLYIGSRARRTLRARRVAPERLFFSPYSVDQELLEAQRRAVSRPAQRAQRGIPEDATVLLFSGKLIDRKDPLLIPRALSRLPSRERTWLVVLGDGELRAAVEREARALLGDRLLLPGFVNQSELGAWFALADLFVLPSHFETWGLVVNEAMQFALPVLCSDGVGAAEDLVSPGVTGWTFPVGDAGALAAALQHALGDEAVRARVGAAARDRIQGFSPRASARGVLAALGMAERPAPG